LIEMKATCRECQYLRLEREGFWMDNGADQRAAQMACGNIKCVDCRRAEADERRKIALQHAEQ